MEEEYPLIELIASSCTKDEEMNYHAHSFLIKTGRIVEVPNLQIMADVGDFWFQIYN